MLARDCYALQWFEDKLGCHLAVGEDGQQVTMDWSDITNNFKKRIKGSRLIQGQGKSGREFEYPVQLLSFTGSNRSNAHID